MKNDLQALSIFALNAQPMGPKSKWPVIPAQFRNNIKTRQGGHGKFCIIH